MSAEAASPLTTPLQARLRVKAERRTARALVAPSVLLLFLWMVVPLGMTI